MAGGNSGSSNGSNTQGSKYLDSMNIQKQNKHIKGTKEYDSSKSTIDIPAVELDQLIRDNLVDAVELPNGKMVLDLPKDVGTVRTKDGQTLGKTNRVTIHKSKTGYHAVPAKKKR